MSAALGRDDPAYRILHLRAVNPAQRLSLRFTAMGVTVRSGRGAASLGLGGIGRAGRLRPVTLAAPRISANRVVYGGHDVKQWFVNGPLGLEQGFNLERRPSGTGPLTVTVAISRGVRVQLDGHGGALLAPAGGGLLHYTDVSAVDATGRALRAGLILRRGRLSLIVDDRGARYPLRIDPLVEQTKLFGSGATGNADQGYSVALSQHGTTALVGGPMNNTGAGAAWVFVLANGSWSRQAMLVGTGAVVPTKGFGSEQGTSVALSGDGDTALIGAPRDDDSAGDGAVWVFTRTGTSWSQLQELKRAGSGGFGASVALSQNGDEALIGAPNTNSNDGAAWVYSASGATFSTPIELTVADESQSIGEFGYSVALDDDGGTALIGGPYDLSQVGAAWIFDDAGGSWAELTKLTGTGQVGEAGKGTSVALSGDGQLGLVGGPSDNNGAGAVWVFFPNNVGRWVQKQEITAPTDESSGDTSLFGTRVSISDDAVDALIGGPNDSSGAGAAWLYTNTSGSYGELQKLTVSDESPSGSPGSSALGSSVALSSDRSTALLGGPSDNGGAGAAWAFGAPLPTATSTTISSSANPSTVEQTVTYTVTVAPAPDGGTVSFTDGSRTIAGCGMVAVSSGVARCQTSFSEVGQDSISAVYSGDTKYLGSRSSSLSQTVDKAFTGTTVSGPGTPAVAQAVTYTARVSPAPDGGTVAFTDASKAIPGCGAVAVSAGTATCQVTFATAVNQTVDAVYSGDANYDASQGVLIALVGPASTTVTTTETASSVPLGKPVTITATVNPAPDGGTILFTDFVVNQTYPGCGAVPVSGGKARCTVTFTHKSDVGVEPFYAQYSGDANYSKSGYSHELDVNVVPPEFSNKAVAISLAQAAGDPAQTGANGSSIAYSGVPLVAGRSTLARVFADPVGLVGSYSAGLTATLSGSAHGKSLAGSPLKPDDGGPAALADQAFAAQLGLANTAFNFILPSSWTTGSVTLTAHVSSAGTQPGGATCDSPCSASLALTSVGFTKVPTFEVTPIELTWTEKHSGVKGFTKGELVAPPSDPQASMALAYELMPVHKIVNEGYQTVIDETALQNDPGGIFGNQADGDALNLVENWASNQFTSATGTNTGDLHDMVVGFNRELARGDTYIQSNIGDFTANEGGIKKGSNVYEPTAVVNSDYTLAVAHEMGHGVGRKHADHACGGPAGGGSDPDWPDYRGRFEPTANLANGVAPSTQLLAAGSSYGVNLSWRVPQSSGTGPFVIFPDDSYDVMSYCGDENYTPSAAAPGDAWISPRGWQQEFDCVKEPDPTGGCPVNEEQPSHGVVPPAGHSAAHTASAVAVSSASPYPPSGALIRGPSISFRGYVEPGGTLISPSLMPAMGGTSGTASSPFTATLTNAGGKSVATEPLSDSAIHFEPAPGHPGLGVIALHGDLPTHGEAIFGLSVRDAGQVVTRIPAPRSKPRVTVRTPRVRRRAKSITVRWQSHDPSKARRSVFIGVSSGSRRFKTVWEGYDQGHATIPISIFHGARTVRLRVLVTDGFASSSATTRKVRLPVVARNASAGSPPWLTELRRDGIDLINP